MELVQFMAVVGGRSLLVKRFVYHRKLLKSGLVIRTYSLLEVYKASEQTMRAIYLVINVGKMGLKETKLIKMRNDASKRGEPLSELEFIDGTLKISASKR